MTECPPIDPFATQRAEGGYLGGFAGEMMPIQSRWRDVRAAAQDWPRFSSDAPGRVPVPAETDIRSLRQLPIEIDPPLHGAYKAMVADYFRRPLKDAALQRGITGVVDRASWMRCWTVCTRDDWVAGHPRAAGDRIALCRAAANFDASVFEAPDKLRLDRSPNPHVGFGSGDHACLGSAHARLVIRTLLIRLAARVTRIDTVADVPGTRDIGGILRRQGHERLVLSFHSGG
jgi:hypothetical protein